MRLRQTGSSTIIQLRFRQAALALANGSDTCQSTNENSLCHSMLKKETGENINFLQM